VRPARFVGRLAKKHWRLLAVVVVGMGLYSGLLALRLGALGLLFDVAKFQNVQKELSRQREAEKGKDAAPPEQVEKGKILQGFEKRWESVVGGPPPTAGMEEPARFYRFMIVFSVAAVVLSLIMGLSFYLKEFLAVKLVQSMMAEVRQGIVDHLVRQSLAFFHRQKAGDLLSRVTNDVVSVNVCLNSIFETLVQDPIAIAFALTVAFVTSWKLSLMVLPCYLFLFVPIFRSGRKVKRYGRGSLEKLGEVTEDLQQLFTGMRTVKAFGMEEHERLDFRTKNQAYIKKVLKMARAKIRGRTFQEVGYNAGTVVLLLLLGCLLYSGYSKLDSGQFVIFMAALVQIYEPVKGVSKAWNQLQESKGGFDRILELVNERPEIKDEPGAAEFPGVSKEVCFDHVSFAYRPGGRVPQALLGEVVSGNGGASKNGAPVVSDVCLRVQRGQVVAIVGPSGAGKSTLVDLLARFYDPQEGKVLVDGEDLRRYSHASYLRSVAIVSQDPFLFNASIGENIAYGRPGATPAEVEGAARKAFAHEFILEQPQGYDTRIGERGVMLSGGQRQRLTIARAILKDAPILILDEATSSLDSAAEKEVQRALENLMADLTTFIIAHRLSTITHADKIVVLDEGRVIEEGTHEGLLQRRGRYWELYRLQNLAS